MAAGLYRIISAFLGHAEAHGWIGAPLLPRKAGAVLAPTVAARARVLTEDELRAVWITADREAPKLRAFVRLLILTAARESEVANMTIGEIDLEMARWTIPAARAKNGMALTLPLGALALAELRAIWPSTEAPPALALLGRGGSAGFQGFSRLKERIDAASGVRDWRWHDLRRTARTGMARLGVPRDHAKAAINHISGRSALERTYDRHDYAAEIIAASNRWQAHVAGLIGEAGRLLAMDRDQRRA
jgi:integrase